MSEQPALLRASGLTRRWGGLVALDRVGIELARGQVHAVIGTNGAGKSTLINILSGEIPPSSGRVELLGQDVTQWSQPRRARAGLGRSYQRNTIFPPFTVFENCRLAAQARTQRPWAWWRSAQACADSTAAGNAPPSCRISAASSRASQVGSSRSPHSVAPSWPLARPSQARPQVARC